MKLRNKKTGKVQTCDFAVISDDSRRDGELCRLESHIFIFRSIKQLNEEYEDYEPAEPLIKDEKIRKAVRAWAETENCTNEMNLFYTLNREEKYITFHNPQTGSELQLRNFDSPVFQEMREYTIAELCGEEE